MIVHSRAWGRRLPSALAKLSIAAVVMAGPVFSSTVMARAAVTLTPIATGFNNPIGVDYHQPTNKLLLSVNYSSGQPHNFELVAQDGSRTTFTSISGFTDEVYISTVRASSCQGGFTTGEAFVGNGQPGQIVRISPDGGTVLNPWVTLPGESGLLRGGLFQDRFCSFGGDLIVTTTSGNVWRVTSGGVPTRLANVGFSENEGPTTVPVDAAKYGPWSGTVLVADERSGCVYSVTAAGAVTCTHFSSAPQPESIRIIPANENFFGVDFSSHTLWGASSDQFSSMVGDVLLASEFPGSLVHLHWNGSTFVQDLLGTVAQWEGTNFAPVGVVNLPPPPPPSESNISATGGFSFTGTEPATVSGTVATFTDADPNSTAAEYAATINWGDGTTSSGTISGPKGGPFTVTGSHTYADEGSFTITVTITDVDTSTNTATVTDSATIADASLTAGTLTVSGGGTEGVTPTSASFNFSDANATATAADFTATIAWGDGTTSAGTVTGGGGSFTVSGTHQYSQEGSYAVSVTVVDDGGSQTSANGTGKVDDAPLAATCSTPPLSSQSVSGTVATFFDANPNATAGDFTATINWGDGTTSAGTINGTGNGPYIVKGSHTYTTTGPVTITVTITDDGGATATATCGILIFGTAQGGNFVIGDENAAVGTQVTFWGARWWKLNTLSGGRAPASFKGFAESPVSPSCGTGWTADPGNSTPPPPGPLPAFMAVIVTSSSSQSGSEISGDTVHVVVVQTNAGYAPDPGHLGTGTVVAQVC